MRRRVRKVDIWGYRLFGLILTAISGFGFKSETVCGDCGFGLIILLIAGLWLLFGDPQKLSKVLR